MRLARFGAVAVLLLAGTVAVGCGPNETSAKGPAAAAGGKSVLELLHSDITGSLRKASETATKANSVRVRGVAVNKGVKVSLDGTIAYGGKARAELSMNMPTLGQDVAVRLVDDVMYMRIPEAQKSMAKGKQWLKIDLAAMAEDREQFEDQLHNADPTKTVQRMLDSGALAVVGDEVIDGVTTVHYSGTMTAEQYVKAVNPQAKVSDVPFTEAKTEIWVDEKYQLRRSRLAGGSMTSDCDYTDYGVAVAVEAPPAAETQDLEDLVGEEPKTT